MSTATKKSKTRQVRNIDVLRLLKVISEASAALTAVFQAAGPREKVVLELKAKAKGSKKVEKADFIIPKFFFAPVCKEDLLRKDIVINPDPQPK